MTAPPEEYAHVRDVLDDPSLGLEQLYPPPSAPPIPALVQVVPYGGQQIIPEESLREMGEEMPPPYASMPPLRPMEGSRSAPKSNIRSERDRAVESSQKNPDEHTPTVGKKRARKGDVTMDSLFADIDGKRPHNIITPCQMSNVARVTEGTEEDHSGFVNDVSSKTVPALDCVATSMVGLISGVAIVYCATLHDVPAWPVMLFGTTTALLSLATTISAVVSRRCGSGSVEDEGKSDALVARVVTCWAATVASVVTWASAFSDPATPRFVALAFFLIITPASMIVSSLETMAFFFPSTWYFVRRCRRRR